MCCFRPRNFLTFIATLAIGVAGVTFIAEAIRRQTPPPQPKFTFEELPIHGFDEVKFARDGEHITIEGSLDIKGLCNKPEGDLCESGFMRLAGSNWQYIPLRLRICSDQVQTNCITRMAVPVDYRYVWIQDKYGKQIDFDGAKFDSEIKAWTYHDKLIRISGRVSVVNGVGRFLEPIEILGISPD